MASVTTADQRSENDKIGIRLKLSAPWVTLMSLCICAGILTIYEPGELN